MEEAAAPQPCRIDKRDGIQYQRVAFPSTHGVSEIGRLDRSLRIVLAVVGRNDAEFPVPPAGVTAGVDERDVAIGLIDASRRALARHTERLAGHDRIVLCLLYTSDAADERSSVD